MHSYQQYGNYLTALRRYVDDEFSRNATGKTIITIAYLLGRMNVARALKSAPVRELDLTKKFIESTNEESLEHRYLLLIESFLKNEDIIKIRSHFKREILEMSVEEFILVTKSSLESSLDQYSNYQYLFEFQGRDEYISYTREGLKELESDNQMIVEILEKMLSPSVNIIFSQSSVESPSQEINSSNNSDFKKLIKLCLKKNVEPHLFDFITQYLLQCSDNKNLFMTQFLRDFQSIYNSAETTAELDRMLERLPALFVAFDSYLQPDETLGQLLQSTSFNLENKSEGYKKYAKVLNLIQGLPIENYSESLKELSFSIQLGLVSILGKNTLQDLKNFPPEIHHFPPLLAIKFMEWNKQTQADFLNFLEKYEQIDKSADSFQQRPIAGFLAQNEEKIIQLIDIMGRKGITFMRKQFATTTLTLERKLDGIIQIDRFWIEKLGEFYNTIEGSDKSSDETFYNCLILAGILSDNHLQQLKPLEEKVEAKPNTILEASQLILPANKNLDTLLIQLASQVLKKLIPEMTLELTQEQIKEMFSRISPEKFTNLAKASHSMANNDYKQVFMQLLKLDLLGGDVYQFLHASNQENLLGKDISEHNASIHSQLVSQGIEPSTALRYPKTSDFVISASKESKRNENKINEDALVVLWDYLSQFQVQTQLALQSKSTESFNKQLQAISSGFETIKRSVDITKPASVVKALSKEINQNLIKKMLRGAEALKSNQAPLEDSFFEYANHVKDQLNSLSVNTKGSAEDTYYVKVEQWPKERVGTFFLGDDVGCCLASDGAQFSAMVQRRLDDALLFHVAVDQVSKKPIALIWLFLAKNEKDEVVLMANFFEVNAKYGNNPEIRKAVLNSLLKFTELYLKDNPNIKGFYMNHLTYGWNKPDLDNYPRTDLIITDKVGGAYIPESKEEKSELPTQDVYYLKSLDEASFHQFSSSILASESTANCVPLKDLIQKSILVLGGNKTDLKKLIPEIYKKHRIAIDAFYNSPDNKMFLADIEKWWSECDLEKGVLATQSIFQPVDENKKTVSNLEENSSLDKSVVDNQGTLTP